MSGNKVSLWPIQNVWSELSLDFRMSSMTLIDSILNLMPVMSDKPLSRPSCSVTKSANSMAFNLFSDLPKHVYLSVWRFSVFHAVKNISQPGGSFAARSALPAAFVLVELRQPPDFPRWGSWGPQTGQVHPLWCQVQRVLVDVVNLIVNVLKLVAVNCVFSGGSINNPSRNLCCAC